MDPCEPHLFIILVGTRHELPQKCVCSFAQDEDGTFLDTEVPDASDSYKVGLVILQGIISILVNLI